MVVRPVHPGHKAWLFILVFFLALPINARSSNPHVRQEDLTKLKPAVAALPSYNPDNRDDLLRLRKLLEEQDKALRENKRLNRGLRELGRITKALLDCTNERDARQLKIYFKETVAALNNLPRPPLPEKMDFFQTPWFFIKRLSRPVGQGRTAASNLEPVKDGADISTANPLPSTFWKRPPDVSTQDLYYGFGRTNFLLAQQAVCVYVAPKESFGRNPGFEIDCSGARLKLKFAEVSSEPFASRLFFALGYHADPTDYAPVVKVRYSRDLLRQFNSRKPLQTRFTFLHVLPLFTLHLQQQYDPFDYLTGAV
ncbi:MAG TPA: hypothetical protein VL793_04330, partial [Patescibacteria group bacterium]|nr:hypothetical protein [Patescibacteria group bacterium]